MSEQKKARNRALDNRIPQLSIERAQYASVFATCPSLPSIIWSENWKKLTVTISKEFLHINITRLCFHMLVWGHLRELTVLSPKNYYYVSYLCYAIHFLNSCENYKLFACEDDMGIAYNITTQVCDKRIRG